MTRVSQIEHEFVDFIPNTLSAGTLYISIPYATTAHLCFCGCGSEIFNPLGPTDWKLTFDGETVSLSPSIGNWSYDCESHYVIRRSRVAWAQTWPRWRIDEGRAKDRFAKSLHYEEALLAAESLSAGGGDRRWLRAFLRRLATALRISR